MQSQKLSLVAAIRNLVLAKEGRLSPSTVRNYNFAAKAFARTLGSKAIGRITNEDLDRHVALRKKGGIGNGTINLELGIAALAMKRHGTWSKLADQFRPLKRPLPVGKALTDDEVKRVLTQAARRAESHALFDMISITLGTAMRASELLSMRWTDVDLVRRCLTIPRSKTAAGVRVIPMSSVVEEILRESRAFIFSFRAERGMGVGAFFNKLLGNKGSRWHGHLHAISCVFRLL